MILLATIILLTSLAIAIVAAYFSVIGLSMLFVGSGVSIIVMGVALEVGKLITITTLKQMWDKLGFLLKTYLIIASIVLSVITSIGVYGFLSNGYNSTSIKINSFTENIKVVEERIITLKDQNKKLENYKPETKTVDDTNKINSDFATQQLQLIDQKELRIKELLNAISNDKKNANESKNSAKLVLDEQVAKELSQIPTFNNRLQILDKEVQSWLEQGTGGLFRQNGLEKARQVKESQQKERDTIDNQIKSVQQTVETLRGSYSKSVVEIEKNLKDQVGLNEQNIKKIEGEINEIKQSILVNKTQTDSKVSSLNDKNDATIKINQDQIKKNNEEIILLNDRVKELSKQINDTDVGTFKFISKNLNLELDKTVNWFIIAIIAVFDPLAVTLLLCFNQILKLRKNKPVEVQALPAIITPQITPTPTIEKINKRSSFFEHKKEDGKLEFKNTPQDLSVF
jgi:hypothetical protein